MPRDESTEPPAPGSKKRRLQGSCDICKQRKIRCDSAKMPGGKCSNCIAFNSECTHVAATTKKTRRRRTKVNGSNVSPRDDLQVHIDAILSTSANYVVPTDPTLVRTILVDLARYVRQLEADLAVTRQNYSPSPSKSASPKDTEPKSDFDEDDDDDEGYNCLYLTEPLNRLTVSQSRTRHYGKSSGIMLVKVVIDLKSATSSTSTFLDNRRPAFWKVHPWQHPVTGPSPPLVFPPPDLIDDLVDLFLSTTNRSVCIVHGPSFKRSVASGLHHTSYTFGKFLLGVCALASRSSNDPRVGEGHSAGWQWYLQLQISPPNAYSSPPTIWDLQLIPLMTLFLYGSSTPEPIWLLTGVGIRMAQDVGAHRKRVAKEWGVQDELWKRTFWALVMIETFVSATCGRPKATHSEQFDVDYPLEVDDEYWPGEELADPANPWTQPKNKPAIATAWVTHLKLLDILNTAQMTIYSVKRPKQWDPAVPTAEWEQNMVVTLDSELNSWIDQLPDHLKWDPQNTSGIFLCQSALLYSTYYWIQMLVHRPFMPRIRGSGKGKTNANFPSLAICTNAARACCHMAEVFCKRGGFPGMPNILSTTYQSAVVLLLHIWSGKRLGLSTNPAREMEDVHKCMEVLSKYENRYQIAGRHHDILRELAEFDVPAMSADVGTSETRKRPREEAGDEGDYGGVSFITPEWAFPMDAAEVMESRHRHEPHSYALDDFIFGAGFGDINALGAGDSGIGELSLMPDADYGWQNLETYLPNIDSFIASQASI
ncbi:fungal-specific transcription factor domain-containing protein [Armillaria fumosa]|nr:fungal-specific transcription factor domain-containing protein [Armillaria fumosa]